MAGKPVMVYEYLNCGRSSHPKITFHISNTKRVFSCEIFQQAC
jgi:hypothetical protein